MDSTRWDAYKPRDTDAIISTSVKAGTTWMQRILSLFVFGTDDLPTSLWQVSPWVDARFQEPAEVMHERIEAMQHPRFLKTHLPLDALPYLENVRYICVVRDTRDVFMSLWNHYGSYTQFTYDILAMNDPVGGPCPRCPDDIHEFWRDYMTRSNFDWETDGYPFWSHHYHFMSFWPYRDLPNVLLVHYNDMKRDLEGKMREVAAFADFDIAEDVWPSLVQAASFESMKTDADRLLPETNFAFEGDSQTFVNKGTNGRWIDTFSATELELYEQAVTRAVPEAEAREWLENGGDL